MEWLTQYARAKTWSWAETRPDIMIGSVFNRDFYSLGTYVFGILPCLAQQQVRQGVDAPFRGQTRLGEQRAKIRQQTW
jgi:hypothetical protein